MNQIIKPSKYFTEKLSIKLNEQIGEQIDQYSNVIMLPEGYTVLHEGEKSLNLYFVLQGIVRGYYIDNQGNDITKCFAYENQFFSTEGLRTGQKSSFTIECIEDCKCIQMPYQMLHACFAQDPDLFSFCSRLYFDEIKRLELRERNFLMMSGEEKYLDFCERYPDLSKRVPLKYIASYIGIRAASLSRIRGKQE
jgi:CRP-like cAMP-binding protein